MGCKRLIFSENTTLKVAYRKKKCFLLGKRIDYYPFGMPMPNRNIEGNYRYKFQGQEKDPETGMEAFEERLWDNRIGRWLTPDPAGKGDSPYTGMYNNPLKYIDVKGRDTLNIYRSKLLKTYGADEDGNYGLDTYMLTFEIIKDGKRLKQDLVLYMYARHDYERAGDNALERNQVYPIKFDQMSDHRGQKGWENTIRLNNAGVFIHPGDPTYNRGCKAVCRESDVPFGNRSYRETFDSTQKALQDVRDLYNTTDQQGMFFITGRQILNTINIIPRGITPMPTPQPQGTRIKSPRYF